MDETEQDIRIIQNEVSVICGSEAEAYNDDRGLNNSDILRKPNSIIILLFVLQQKQRSQQKPLSKEDNFYDNFNATLLQFMRNTAPIYRYDIYQSCPHADTRFIMSAPRYGKLSVGFQPRRIRENLQWKIIYRPYWMSWRVIRPGILRVSYFFFRAPKGWGKMRETSKMLGRITSQLIQWGFYHMRKKISHFGDKIIPAHTVATLRSWGRMHKTF